MAFMAPTALSSETDGLATYAEHLIMQVATALHGLTPEQLRATPSASAMSIGALARHLILVSGTSAARIAAAPAAGERLDRDPAQAQAEGSIAPEAVREDDTAEILIEELRAAGAAVAEAIRAADPDTPMPVPDQPWFAGMDSWTVRWYALHQVEEAARHAGHADILRESIDGKGAYELNALADGEPWPPEGW